MQILLIRHIKTEFHKLEILKQHSYNEMEKKRE